MPSANHDLAVRWFEEFWNQGREDAVERLSQPDAESYAFPQADSVLNGSQFIEFAREFRRSFSDIHIQVEETVSEDDRVAVRWTGTMKHSGGGLGIPPTGMSVKVVGMTFLHLRDGRIQKAWNALDLGSVIEHLSAISSHS